MKTKYEYRGFTIKYYHSDNEFEHPHNFLAPDHLHTFSANKHINDIERSIWIIKEQVRCGCHFTPYKKFKKSMTRSLVQDTITCLNMFPSKNGISKELSQAAIILGPQNLYDNKLKVTFGVYAQVYIGTTNSKKQRMVWAISPRPENKRCGYYFMSPATGKQLHAFIWTELPIKNQVVSRVIDLVNK